MVTVLCEACPLNDPMLARTTDRSRYKCPCEWRQNVPVEPALPPLAERLANYARAKGAHVLAGSRDVDDETFRQRIAICEAWPEFRASDRKCSKCGCPLDRGIEHKARWAGQTCPAKPSRWEAAKLTS